MPVIFDRGNAFLNGFVTDLMDIKPDDRIFEIGCGTGKLIKLMANEIEGDVIRLLTSGGFRKSVRIDTRKRRNLLFHCAVATK